MPNILPQVSEQDRQDFLAKGYKFYQEKPLPNAFNPWTTEYWLTTGAILTAIIIGRAISKAQRGPVLPYTLAGIATLYTPLCSKQKLDGFHLELAARRERQSLAREAFNEAVEEIKEENADLRRRIAMLRSSKGLAHQ